MPVNSPIALAAFAPASTAAVTAATSPATKTVTKPDPTFSYETSSTSADLHIISAAAIAGTIPFVSTRPNASPLYFIDIPPQLIHHCSGNYSNS